MCGHSGIVELTLPSQKIGVRTPILPTPNGGPNRSRWSFSSACAGCGVPAIPIFFAVAKRYPQRGELLTVGTPTAYSPHALGIGWSGVHNSTPARHDVAALPSRRVGLLRPLLRCALAGERLADQTAGATHTHKKGSSFWDVFESTHDKKTRTVKTPLCCFLRSGKAPPPPVVMGS